MVEDVEGLSPKLQPRRFAKANVLDHGEVNALGGRAVDYAARGIAGRVWQTCRRVRRIRLEARRVEVLLLSTRVRVAERVCVWIRVRQRQALSLALSQREREKAEPANYERQV